jgi:hypothetical protein
VAVKLHRQCFRRPGRLGRAWRAAVGGQACLLAAPVRVMAGCSRGRAHAKGEGRRAKGDERESQGAACWRWLVLELVPLRVRRSRWESRPGANQISAATQLPRAADARTQHTRGSGKRTHRSLAAVGAPAPAAPAQHCACRRAASALHHGRVDWPLSLRCCVRYMCSLPPSSSPFLLAPAGSLLPLPRVHFLASRRWTVPHGERCCAVPRFAAT